MQRPQRRQSVTRGQPLLRAINDPVCVAFEAVGVHGKVVVVKDLIISVIVMSAMVAWGVQSVRVLPASERLYPYISLAAHMVTGPLLLVIMDYVFVVSDVHGYFILGEKLSALLRADLARWGPELFKLFLQWDNDLSTLFPEDFGGLYATTSMCAAVGAVMFVFDDAQYASFIFMAGATFYGKLASYRGMRLALPGMDPKRVALAMMLIPSVVFWSSGVVKESFAVTGIGLLTLWIARVAHQSVFASPHLFVIGLPLVGLIKPYLLFPFALAAGAWLLLKRSKSSSAAFKPLYVIGTSVGVFAVLAGLSSAFPDFSPAKFGESVSTQQELWTQTGGGSNFSLGNTQATTFSGQMLFAPVALLTVLARPFIFEVRNFTMLIAALETTVLLVWLVQLFRKNTLAQVIAAIQRTPPLAYCFVFTMVSGVAIGLATANFGSLSRYRIPMMPFYVLLVLVLSDRTMGVAAQRRVR